MPVSESYAPRRDYAALGEGFFDPVRPARFPLQRLRFRNQAWAERVGLGTLSADEWTEHFVRFAPLPGNLTEPLALRYHGHQFDSYNPEIGDGRGFLFAQLQDANGRLLDLGTKGSGRTPFSRTGDGRLTLKGGVREVLATELLEALGVYTSKSFSLFETGEALMRGDEPSPTRSSVLVRLGHSHVRIGTFQRLMYEGDAPRIRRLIEYSVEHLLPSLRDHADLLRAFGREVCRRSARLCAQWMVAGFVHGVLNSDNMVVTGESFDYGPYRFLPHYDPDFVAAYFDHSGLYAFARQPRAVFRNVQRLVQTLASVEPGASWDIALDGFAEELRRERADACVRRFGLVPAGAEADAALASAAWDYLALRRVRFEELFFDWWGGPASTERALSGPRASNYRQAAFYELRELLDGRRPAAPERLDHPYFRQTHPCTLLIDEIERIWSAVAERDDWSLFDAKLEQIAGMRSALGLADSSRTGP